MQRRRPCTGPWGRPSKSCTRTGWRSITRSWRTTSPRARCGRRPWHIAGRRGEGHGAVGLPRGGGVLRAGARCPATSARGRDTCEQAIDLRLATCAMCSLPLWRLWAYFDLPARGREPRRSLDDHHRLGRISAYLCSYFQPWATHDHAIAAGQRALALATASGDVFAHDAWRRSLGSLLHSPWVNYRQAIDCLAATMELLTGHGATSALAEPACPLCSPVPILPGVWPRWALRRGQAHGEEALRIAEAVDHPASLMLCVLGLGFALPPPRGPARRASPLLERGLRSVRRRHPVLSSPGSLRPLGAAYALAGRVAEALPLLAQARGADHCHATMIHYQTL